jgi:UDP-glucose 4-epimerase
MRRYLVTGGCGFIGSHLVSALLAAGHDVRVIDDLSTGSRARLPAGAALAEADLAEADLAAALDGVDGVFHLAAIASVARSTEAWVATHRTNLTATIQLFDALRRGPNGPVPVVFASSAAVYGDRAGAIDEAAGLAPLSPYGADKAGCELHALAGARVHGIASVGLRFFNVYGPGQRADDAYAGVISLFADRIRRGEPLTIHGDGRQSRDFVFVGDVVRVLRIAMDRLHADPAPTATIANVGTGRATTIDGLARTLMTVVGRDVPITHGPPRPGDIRSSLADVRRMHRLFGHDETTPLERGLQQLLAATDAA